MKRYRVILEEVASYTLEVEAENEEAAAEAAEEAFVQSPDFSEMECSVSERDAISVEEIEED